MLKHFYSDARTPARVVVLGAGGFIGGAIARKLSAGGIAVLAIGRPKLDLLNSESSKILERELRSDDVLVFASAKAPCKNLAMLRENLVMAESVCEALKAKPVAQLVYISSDAVYKDSSDPFLVYGLEDSHNGYGPNRFRWLAAAGREIVLFGEGEECRDHVDADDVAELVRLIVLHRSAGIANAVSGEMVSFRELAEFVASEFAPRVRVHSLQKSVSS